MDLLGDTQKTIFSITVEDLQIEAARLINRKLTNREMHTALKCIESGLSSGINTIFSAAIEEATE